MRLLLCPLVAAALTAGAALSQANAAGIENPSGMQLQSAPAGQPKAAPKSRKKPVTPTTEGTTRAPDKKSEHLFIEGYRTAYDLIYRQQDYASAIVTLTALGRDEHPDVANLIGFASRKLGRTEDARAWYEKALAADPKHTRTWQYYGMWQLERGERAKAEDHLRVIEAICGTECEDYTSLKLALNGDGLVY
jgi:tetratricopeptide (TPR) repeat protein